MAGNFVFHSHKLKGTTVNEERGATATPFDSTYGKAEMDPTDTSLVSAVEEQGAVQVDFEGTGEALTPGTVQTATTCSAIYFNNDAGAVVLNIRNEDGTGTLLVGPITVAASSYRIIVFPIPLAAPAGIFIDLDSGTLDAAPGVLIP